MKSLIPVQLAERIHKGPVEWTICDRDKDVDLMWKNTPSGCALQRFIVHNFTINGDPSRMVNCAAPCLPHFLQYYMDISKYAILALKDRDMAVSPWMQVARNPCIITHP